MTFSKRNHIPSVIHAHLRRVRPVANQKARLAAMLAASVALSACHSSSSSGGGSQPPPSATAGTYEATLTGVKITRLADGQSMAVSGLPEKGAQLTVR
jgi:hypothetical protein